MADTKTDSKPGFFEKFNNPSIWITLAILFSAGAVQYNNVTVVAERLSKYIDRHNEIVEEVDVNNIERAISNATTPLLIENIDLKGHIRQLETEKKMIELELRICKDK